MSRCYSVGATTVLVVSRVPCSELGLEQNRLEGSLRPSLSALSALETLLLADNAFTGSIPSVLSRISKLACVTRAVACLQSQHGRRLTVARVY
jgi:hypothetical protein